MEGRKDRLQGPFLVRRLLIYHNFLKSKLTHSLVLLLFGGWVLWVGQGYYFTGDGCRRDEDGYYWITGRVDDVLNCSGHRLGTAEIEAALCVSDKCSEAAVVGFPHDIKGQGIACYVVLATGVAESDAVVKELKQQVRTSIGAFATPDMVAIIPGLPKTRSGKIMRRILRKVVAAEEDSLGDTSTLADPSVVEKIIETVKTIQKR